MFDDGFGGSGDSFAMSDDDDNFAVVCELTEKSENFVGSFFIKIASGFVGDDDGVIAGHGAGDGDALLFATG